jgi:ribosomal protein L40E
MRLAALLSEQSDTDLQRLAIEHVRTDEKLARPQLCNFLEGALRSFSFVSSFIVNRQPPTFSILTLLLESPGYERPVIGFKEAVMTETSRLITLIEEGELLARERQLHLYRRSFYEARRNDLDINNSEAALLAVLRREQRISQAEHFLIEHHKDFHEFWNREGSFAQEINALRYAGIIFLVKDRVLIPEDVAPSVWQTLGLDMPSESARRLLGYLSNSELAEVLESAGTRVSGTKEQRLERILLERIQPHVALQNVGLQTLKEICRSSEAPSTGNKDELIQRIIQHFAQGRDQIEPETIEVRIPETRRLQEAQFQTLFEALQHQELSDILRRQPELRQTGTKETRIRTLWEAHLSENTLLGELTNRQLEEVLQRLGLRISGAKHARIERIVAYFELAIPTRTIENEPKELLKVAEPSEHYLNTDVIANQAEFRRRASNPQASLQPWLDELLNARGLVRCYATEDNSPTKQLKNKLSQAAAARDGILVLLLSDVDAYKKAREALIKRWMTNSEWSKNVACIALAHPLGEPSVSVIIERTHNAWASTLRSKIFPEAEIVRVASEKETPSLPACMRCSAELPKNARFCPNCGSSIKLQDGGDQ